MLGMGSQIEEGTPVGLRLDIPAYRDHGVWIPTTHPRGGTSVLAHEPVARVTDAELSMPQAKALAVARGVAKSPFAKIEGRWKPVDQEEALSMADEALRNPDWRQVGMDPERHSYFYDRASQEPIIGSEDVLQVGPLVLAKKPVYGSRDDFHYAEGGRLLEDEHPSHYMPGVGRQVMHNGGALAPAINQLTAQLLAYGWQAPRLEYLKRVPRQGFEDGGVAAALDAIQNTVGASRAPRAPITASDLIGTSDYQAQNPGAYTDAGGQKIAAPFTSSMRGGYPVYNFPQPEQPKPAASAPSQFDWVRKILNRNFADGGDVEGGVEYAPEGGHTQMPPIDIGQPHERPNYDRGETMRAYEPTAWERLAQSLIGERAPSPERRHFVEGMMGTSGLGDEKMSIPEAAHLAASFYPPTMGGAALVSGAQLANKTIEGRPVEASDVLSLVPTGAGAAASIAAAVLDDHHRHEAARDVLARMRAGKAGGGGFRHFGKEAALRAAEIAKNIAAGVKPSERIGVFHSLDAARVPEMVRRFEGAIPAPSLAIAKPGAMPTDFGDTTLIGRAHLAVPDEHNTVFASDAYTPRTPQIFKGGNPDTAAKFAQEFIDAHGGDKSAAEQSIRDQFVGNPDFVKKVVGLIHNPAPLGEYIVGRGGERVAPTMENIISAMKARPLVGGESDNNLVSIGLMRALAQKPFESIEEIQKYRPRMSSEFNPEDPDWKDAYYDAKMLGSVWKGYISDPAARDVANRWPEDTFMRATKDYLTGNRNWDQFRQHYPDIPDVKRHEVDRFVSSVGKLNPSYFEAKQMRPVGLDEFSGAIIPKGVMGDQAAEHLVRAGVPESGIQFYDPVQREHMPDNRVYQLFRSGDEERFDKGGVVKKAIDALSRYREPKSQFIKDWKWRPLRDVQADVGTTVVPEHVQNFGRYMSDISDKAATEGLDPEDLIKAYMITRSSIQREGRTPAKLASQGALIRQTDEPLVRPEGQMAEWLQTQPGIRFLNEARKGDLSQDVVDAAMRVMKPYGMSKAEPDAMDWARRNLPDQAPLVSDLVARARTGESPASEWRDFTSDVRGIGPAKTGFIASLLGRGDLPTLDARQAILHTGMKNADVQDIMSKRSGRVGHEAVDRLAARQRAMGFELPEELDPFYQHLAHHTVWDAVGNEKTTHQDIIDAMKPRAEGGEVDGYGPGGKVAERLAVPLEEALKRVYGLFHDDNDAVEQARRIVSGWQIPDSPKKGGYYGINQSRAPSAVTTDLIDLPGIVTKQPRNLTWDQFYDLTKGGSFINIGGDRSNLGRLRGINGRPLAWNVDLHAGPKYALEPNPGAVWANAPGIATRFKNSVLEETEKGRPVFGILSPMGPMAVNSSHNMVDTLLAQIPGQLKSRDLTKTSARDFDKFLREGLFASAAGDQEKRAAEMVDWPGLLNPKEASDFLRTRSGGLRRDFSVAMDKGQWRDRGMPLVGETRVAITDPSMLFLPSNAMGHRVVRFDPNNMTPESVAFKHSTYPVPTGGEYIGDIPALPRQYVMPTAMEKEMQTLTRNQQVVHPMSSGSKGRDAARKMFEEQKLVQPIDEDFLNSVKLGMQRRGEYGFRKGGSVVDEALALVSRARRAA
jgi:hypothetical protein